MTAKGVMTRFTDEDAALRAWMEPFATNGKQGDLIRAALYITSGLPMPAGLRYIVPDLPGATEAHPADALVGIGERIARAVEGLQGVQRAPEDRAGSAPERSSGLDMSPLRKKADGETGLIH